MGVNDVEAGYVRQQPSGSAATNAGKILGTYFAVGISKNIGVFF